MSQEFLSDLEFSLNATPFDSSDSDYDIWYKKAESIDNTLKRYNIDNPALADQLKAKYLKEKPPDPSILSQAMRGMIPGIKQSVADLGMGIGASLSSPHLSAFQQAEKDGLFKPGMSYAEKEEVAKKIADDRAMFEGYSKGVDPSTRKFIPFGIHERPKAGVIPSMIGESLFDVSKNYADELKAEDLKRDKAETKEEYLARQEKEGTWIDRLQAYPVEKGFVEPPGQLARSYGRSVGGQVMPMAVGGVVAGVGAITRKPSLVNTGLGLYRAGTPLATSGTVAGSMYDTIAQNERIEAVIRNQIESQYPPEELIKPNVKKKIDRQVKRELDREAVDIVGRAFSERLTSPQTLLEFAGTFQQGGLITNLLANAGLEAGSEAFDSALEQTYVNRKLRELYRKEGKTEKEIDELVSYDQIGKYKIDDWMKVVRGGTSGVLMSGPTAVVETGLNLLQDKRVEGRNLDDDKEMQSLKDEADDLRNAMNYERQVNLQEQKLIIEEEKTKQARLKNQTGDTAPTAEPVLDQEEVQQAYDDANQDTPIGEGVTPNLAPIEQPTMTQQEQADVQALDDQMLNPDVINPLSPEQVAESQEQRTQQLRQEELDADAEETLGVNPEDIAPVGPEQTEQEVQEARDEMSDAMRQRLELQDYYNQNRQTLEERRSQVETTEEGATLRSLRDDPDSDTEAIPNPQEEGGASILPEALPQEEVETATEPQRPVLPEQRLNRGVAEAVVALFRQRFPNLLGEINVLSNEDYSRVRGKDAVAGVEGEYSKGTGYVDILFENIIGRGETQKSATDRLVEVLWHEALGHKGLVEGLNNASVDGKGYERFIDNIIRDYGDDPEFRAFVQDSGLDERTGAEEFVVRKFAEGNTFSVRDGELLEKSIDGSFVPAKENQQILAEGILENKFIDSLIASFKEAIGRDGINKGRLDDRQIRHIMLALKMKAMQSGHSVLNPAFAPTAQTEQDEEMFLEEGDQGVVSEATDDGMFTQEGGPEPQVLRSLGRNINVRRAHNWAKQKLRWTFEVGDDTIDVRAGFTSNINEILSGRTMGPDGISTFDRLIDKEPEFRQKIESLGIDPSKDVMELSFDRVDPRGESRYDTTGGGDQFSIFSGVAVAGRELMAKQPDTVMFTAEEKVDNVPEDREVAGRVRLYDRFADGLAQEFGYEKISHVYEGGLKGVYVLKKPQTLQSRRRPITGQDDFARRAVGKRYASPEEFSESALRADKTLNDLQKLDEYDRQMKFREGGRKYLPTRDNPQIREIVDAWLEEREDQKQGQKTKLGELFRRIKEVSDERITPGHVDKYRNFLRNENKKLRSIRNATAKSRQVFENPVDRTPLNDLLANEVSHEARARIIKDYGNKRFAEDDTESTEDLLQSFRQRGLHSRVENYNSVKGDQTYRGTANIKDIVGGDHSYAFSASGGFGHPGEIVRRGNEQDFIDKGFNLDVLMNVFNVSFNVDGSYSVENWEVPDPTTGEMVKAKMSLPIFSALKESLQNVVEAFNPDAITFTGAERARVEAYDMGMEILGKKMGYNVLGVGDSYSKSYYMQRKDVGDTNPTVPRRPSDSATIQDMAWQFMSNMSDIATENIERVLTGSNDQIDLGSEPNAPELLFQSLVQDVLEQTSQDPASVYDTITNAYLRGLRTLRDRINDVYQDLEQRRKERLFQENAEKAGSFFVRVANNDPLVRQISSLALPDTLGEYIQNLDDPYNTFFNYGRNTGLIRPTLGYSPELHNVVLNLQQLGNFTWDSASQRFFALGQRMTPSQFQTYLNSPHESNQRDPGIEDRMLIDKRDIHRFIMRQIPGLAPQSSDQNIVGDAVTISAFNEFTDAEIIDSYMQEVGNAPNLAERVDPSIQREYVQNIVNNVRAFLAEENRVYDLNEEFTQRIGTLSSEALGRIGARREEITRQRGERENAILEIFGFDDMPIALQPEAFARLDGPDQIEEIKRVMEEDLRGIFDRALLKIFESVGSEGMSVRDFETVVMPKFAENTESNSDQNDEFRDSLDERISAYTNLMDSDAFERLNQWGGWEEEGSRLARLFFDQNPQVLPEGLPYANRERIAMQAGEAFLHSIWQGRSGSYQNPVLQQAERDIDGILTEEEITELEDEALFGGDFEPEDDPINEPTDDIEQADIEYQNANREEQRQISDNIFSQMEPIINGLQAQIEALPTDTSQPFRDLMTSELASFLDQQPFGFLTDGHQSRGWSAWFSTLLPNLDAERRQNTLYGWIDSIAGARRRRREQNTQQTLRSIRPGVKMVEVHNTNNTANDYQSMFYLPDGSKVEAQSTTSAYPRDITDYLDDDLGQRTIKTLLSQGLNPRKKLQYWNVSFDRDGSTDIMGNATEQHKVANGIKQYLEQLIVDKVPEGIWFSAYDPGLRAVGDGFEVNPDKIGARIRVYKLGAKALGREYGYTLGLVRNDMDNAYFYMQRNDLVGDPQAFENIVEDFNDSTGKQVTYEYLSNVRRSFDRLVNSVFDSRDRGDYVPYTSIKGTIPANFRQSIIQAYDSIPQYLQDGLDTDVADQVVNDLRSNPSPISDPDITLQSVRNPVRNPETQPPTPEESTEALPETGGIPNSKFGRWAHSVMNYLRGKQLGDLKNEEQYLLGRYRALGEIARMTELGQRFYEIFKDAKNPREIYSFLTTQGANPEMIPDARERAVAIEAKDEIIKIGEDLKDLGLLRESTLKAMRGQYLPRIYLTHLLNDETVRTLQGGGRPSPSQLAYLKNRKDINPAVRELILREIKDPDYLVGRALMIPGRDIALINWFREIAQNPDWAYQPSLVTFDTLQEVENIINAGENAQALLKIYELDPSIKDRREELQSRIKFTQQKLRGTKDSKLKRQYQTDLAQLKEQLKMLKPRKVTGEYLKDESIRLREQIIPTLEGRTKEIGEALAQRMSELANQYANVAYDQMFWRKIPNTKRFGQLKNMIVRREIYDDIVGSSKVIEEDPYDSWNNLFGEGGTVAKAGQFWKWSKVAGNFPASHVRNFISNLSLMHLGGVPGQSIPGLLKKAVTEMIKNGEHFRIAKKYGLKGSSFSANELGAMEKEFTELKKRLDKGEGNWVTGTFGAIRRAFEGFKEGTSYSYEMMEALGKTMMIIDGMNRMGLSEGDAVLRAQKYLFDYSLLPSWGRKMRQSISFGSPFFTFYFKTLPVLLETVRERPWKFIPYFLMGQVLHQSAKAVMDMDEEEAEALRMSMPEFLRNKHHVYMLPWRDENDRVVYFDASYLLPWGMFSELLQEISPVNVRSAINLTPKFETKNPSVGDAIRTLGLASGPFLTATAGFMTNKDPFTQRTIWNERDPASAQNASKLLYLWNLATPTMLAGIPDIWMNTDQQRLQGSIRKLYGALNDELNKRGLPKDTVGQSSARFFGLNTYGFNPAQAVRDSMYFGRQGVRDAMSDMRIELRNMQRSGKSSEEINARRKTLLERIVREQEKLRKYQKATRKAVAL